MALSRKVWLCGFGFFLLTNVINSAAPELRGKGSTRNTSGWRHELFINVGLQEKKECIENDTIFPFITRFIDCGKDYIGETPMTHVHIVY